MEKNKTHWVWLTSSWNKHPSKKTCTQKSHSFCFVWEMTQLWWKHQCTGNRKWRKMHFQMSSKQRKLKVGETSKHWNIKAFALGVKRKIDLHPKVFTVKSCGVSCPSPGLLYNYTGKPWRHWEMKDQGKFRAPVFKLDFILKAAASIGDLKKGV